MRSSLSVTPLASARTSPDLPGCVAAAQTIEEVRALIQGAIRMHVAGLREDGQSVPEPQSRVEYVDA
jgi:predicted RNase H-like HicB family nuclease